MYLAWSGLFEIGVGKIDAEHRQLVSILNAFHEESAGGASRAAVFLTLNKLIKYAEEHFTSEEALMESARYPGLLKQKSEHFKFTEKIFRLAAQLEKDEAMVADDLMAFLKSWLIEHILNSDKALGDWFRERDVPARWRVG